MELACNIFRKVDVPGPLLGRDSLWFDSCKRPPPVSDHSVFAFWVVAYDRFDCSSVRPRQREKTFDGTFHVKSCFTLVYYAANLY